MSSRAHRAEGLSVLALKLLTPLIGIQGQQASRVMELVEILHEGPSVVLLDTSSPPSIRADQYGDPRIRSPRTFTLPIISESEPDVHPVLRAMLPGHVVAALRLAIPGNATGRT